ncbi:MAG: hypothetical protein R3232_09630, partial [Clostridia bacterium]|nr:hypothetical protein [Clostridia bacterium]
LMKILIWLIGIIAGVIIVGIIFIIPMGKPLFSVQFIAIVGGYGLVSMLFYRTGKMPGHKTKLRILNSYEKVTVKQATLGLLLLMAFCSLSFLARASGLNKVFTSWQNITWHFLFALLMSLGFLVLGRESEIISANATKPYQKVLWNIVKYFPFYIFAVFYLAIGSLSGLTGAIQGLAFLFYAIYAGKVVYSVSGSSYLPAICTAIILSVPTGAVF